ncbi:MAG: RNA-guided endonuclease InsQ/TnpB family protein [Senegalia sp. (in: firmicutes)]|uniref:RNA-guided endonuclease InsQ/TnpB family protein n=1 Tax=Senegalia sp. (in: firmicutes) TaxID=1924098 RepID=UPI003F9CA8BC
MGNKEGEEKILRTQSIRIKKSHNLYDYCDNMCFLSKNLYNTTNFYIRQVFSGIKKDIEKREENEKMIIDEINSTIPELNDVKVAYTEKRKMKELKKPISERKEISEANLFDLITIDNPYTSYNLLDGVFKINKQTDYMSLPSHSNQHIMKLAFSDWKSFYASLKEYKKNPSKYKGKPKPPKYAKNDGRKIAFFSNQTCKINDNHLRFPKTKEKLNIGKLCKTDSKLKQVRILPGPNYYTIEIVFELNIKPKAISETPERIFGIDLGIDNFATIVNNVGENPIIINGKAIKSINQYYNKKRAHYYSILRKGKSQNQGLFNSNRLNRIDLKRNDKVKDFLHKASFNIISKAMDLDIDTIIIGKNKDFKENIKLRKDIKLNFKSLPYAKFIEILKYKANEKGINVLETEESYTSKASFLDNDKIPCFDDKNREKEKPIFSGKRIKRGLYKSKEGILINADCNGAANIIRKVVPNAFSRGNRGVVSTPLVLSIA